MICIKIIEKIQDSCAKAGFLDFLSCHRFRAMWAMDIYMKNEMTGNAMAAMIQAMA